MFFYLLFSFNLIWYFLGLCFYLRKCLRNHSSSFVLTLTQYSVVHLWFCYIIYTWLVCSATFSSLFLNASLNTKLCILCLWFLLHFIYLCRSKIPFGPRFPLSTDSLPRPLSVFLSCTVVYPTLSLYGTLFVDLFLGMSNFSPQ